ncbi:ABC transporter ATP-binding protein [Planctomycetota bacterium]
MNKALPAIAIDKLTVIYQKGLLRKPGRGVNDLSLQVEPAELFGFLGPNGAGKTTTIKVLTGLLRPAAGQVLIQGKPVSDKRTRRLIGYMPENPYFYEYLTAAETLAFYGGIFKLDRDTIRQRSERLLHKVGLDNVEGVRVGEYSKGMRQRLGFAQALINEPEVVILDEPLSGLDPLGRNDLMEIMRELNQEGRTVFFSSHILPDVENACTRVALINEGELIQTGPMAEILDTGTQAIELLIKGEIPAGLPDTVMVAARPGQLQALTAPDQAAADELLRELTSAGRHIISVNPVRRSLEDFFIDQINREKEQ